MGSLVPEDDLPGGLVPEGDLPDAPAAPAAPSVGPEGSSKWDQIRAGIGMGMVKVGRNLHDLLVGLPGNEAYKRGAPPGAYDPLSKENWQDWNKINEPLRNAEWSKEHQKEHAPKLPAALMTGDPATDARLAANIAAKPRPPSGPGRLGESIGEMAASLPVAMSAGAPLRAMLGASGAGLGRRILAGGLSGAGEGAAAGAVTADDPSQRGVRALAGGTAGLGIGAVIPALASGLRRGAEASVPARVASADVTAESAAAASPPTRTVLGAVLQEPHPIPEAAYLQSRGVKLTKGLYDPASSYGQVELASTSKGGVGPLIGKQRHQALVDAMNLAFEDSAPPGAKMKLTGDINARYSTLKDAWDSAYDAIRAKGETIYPAVHDGQGGVALSSTANKPGLLDQIVNDPGTIWDDESRRIAKKFLDNQMTRLPETRGSLGKVELNDMLEVLSNIKKAGRAALKKQNYDIADIMGQAQDAVEQAVESQASPETSAALKALNGKYRDFKVIEDAVVRSGDSPGGLLPSRLAAAVKAGESSRSRYAAGGGGPLRELSQAISKVFDESASPPTGARLLTAMPGWLNDTLVAPTVYARNAAPRAASGAAQEALTAGAKRRFLLSAAADAAESAGPRGVAPAASQSAQIADLLRRFGLAPATADDREGRP